MATDVNDGTESYLEELLFAAWAEQLAQLRAQINSSEPMTRESSPGTIGKERKL